MIFTYLFEDGIEFKLVDAGLSTEEILALQELHGELIIRSEMSNKIEKREEDDD